MESFYLQIDSGTQKGCFKAGSRHMFPDQGVYGAILLFIWVVVKTVVPFWVPEILGAVLY